MVEVRGERHEARLRESVADPFEDLGEAPPGMQDQHPWSAAALGNGQIGANRSAKNPGLFEGKICVFNPGCKRQEESGTPPE